MIGKELLVHANLLTEAEAGILSTATRASEEPFNKEGVMSEKITRGCHRVATGLFHPI